MRTIARHVLLSLAVLAGSAAAAQVYVPPELENWRAWVLEGHEYVDCPFYFDRAAGGRDDYVCAWPERLELDVVAGGARFTQTWRVFEGEAFLPLPGGAEHWPESVTVNGADARVVVRDGRPAVPADPGTYTLDGRFRWEERPGILPLPPAIGLVTLTVDGRRIVRPSLDARGVFLGEQRETAVARDALGVEVYRLVADAIPTRLVTRLELDVAGSVREVRIDSVLADAFVPVSLTSPLPARLEADGGLLVQVRPGRWVVELVARADGVLDTVSVPAAETSLPASEIWSYDADESLRVTAVEGLPPVDPGRVGVPAQWRQLPAFRVTRGDTLTIVERSRGLVATDNQLALSRSMWLDFDGGGFLVRDEINGTMRAGWRLDMREPYVLESASSSGENLLVTLGDEPGRTGVEVRATNPRLTALGELGERGSMPVSGWDQRFDRLAATLYLPPGHKLLAAPGVDSASGSWVGQWQLLDFFLVLIITIAAYRLFGWQAGLVALGALSLSYHEMNAPAWLWLNLLVALALYKVAPGGRIGAVVRGYVGASALLLVVALVPFLATQLRIAIYPQLEPQWGVARYAPATPVEEAPLSRLTDAGAPAQVEPQPQKARREAESDASLEDVVVTARRPSTDTVNLSRYAPDAIVQAGPGIPDWQWNANRLSWSGPVDVSQTMSLVILPRWAVTLLRFLEVALLLLFAAILAAHALGRRWRLPGGVAIGRPAGAAVLLVAVGLAAAPVPEARAELPPPELLRELETRLTAPPDCVPRCGEIAAADIEVGSNAVDIRLSVDALEAIAIPLPGSAEGWRPDAVGLDGREGRIIRDSRGNFWLQVPPGRHDVRVTGATGAADSIEIAFPVPPRVVSVSADGWLVAGVRDRRLVSGALTLSRLGDDGGAAGDPGWEASRFPAFVRVVRSIELGLDWRVTTEVTRIAPVEGAISLAIPLIDGESVVSEGLAVDDGAVQISMNPAQRAVRWQSTLPRTSPLVLAAPADVPWTEVWRVAVGPLWHADFSGVPQTASSAGGDARIASFHPRGGETLEIVAMRPEGAGGNALAFDAATVSVDQGARSRTTSMALAYRSTRGAQHEIELPADAEVTEVRIDGRVEPLRAENGRLTLPILPGSHSVGIVWQESIDADAVTSTPSVVLDAPTSNIRLNLVLPQNRWLLMTDGPPLGPAVLYWSELAVLVLLALVLGRIDWTPLKFRHWLLLGLGFSTFSWPVLGIVVAWLLIVGARDRWRFDGSWWQYNLQQALVALLTLAALFAIVISLPAGLLGTPDMHVTGNGSAGNSLAWFADRTSAVLPSATALSAPMWLYKALILAWALWLSFALIRWLPWTWRCFAKDGFFRSRRAGAESA